MSPDPATDWTRNGARVVCGLLLAVSCAIGVVSTARLVRADATLAMPVSVGIDINAATTAELGLLPGIGPALSGAIVEERERFGRFVSIDDLTRVRGIGERRVANIAQHAVVSR